MVGSRGFAGVVLAGKAAEEHRVVVAADPASILVEEEGIPRSMGPLRVVAVAAHIGRACQVSTRQEVELQRKVRRHTTGERQHHQDHHKRPQRTERKGRARELLPMCPE